MTKEGVRITPTYMGNTAIYYTFVSSNQDHPHIHGEYILSPAGTIEQQGSPPHTWGIQIVASVVAWQVRITPTYMGNTQVVGRNVIAQLGSPPHTWGILGIHLIDCLLDRITPTYMGNTYGKH